MKYAPIECKCGHVDREHEPTDERFGACLKCVCPGFTTAELEKPPPAKPATKRSALRGTDGSKLRAKKYADRVLQQTAWWDERYGELS